MIDKIKSGISTVHNLPPVAGSKPKNLNFTHFDDNNLSHGEKAIILGSAAVGVLSAVAVLAKMKGFSLNPARILKTNWKDWALFKYKHGTNAIIYEEPEIIGVASASVLGGFVGGSIVDKRNIKAKKREVVNQILGNVLVPVACVGFGSRMFNKYAETLQKAMPQIAKNTKPAKIINACLQNIPNAVSTLASLSVGIFAGNRVSNFLNEKIYHKEIDRDIRATDFAPHVDDVCMAASLTNKGSSFGDMIARVIPLALLVPGYEAGSAQE